MGGHTQRGFSARVVLVRSVALALLAIPLLAQHSAPVEIEPVKGAEDADWPVLKRYDQDHIARIALPLGGIGTGTVSLGGRGDLRDWEIVNRPAKGFTPQLGEDPVGPFFALYVRGQYGGVATRAVEGPIDASLYEGPFGSVAVNHGLPRFRKCSFAAAYPLGQVFLSDPDMPVDVTIQAFNPMVPCDLDRSSIPVAVLRYVLSNKTVEPLSATVCGTIPNFIGSDGSRGEPEGNINEFRKGPNVQGIFMRCEDVNRLRAQWGTMALSTTATTPVTYRTSWIDTGGWGGSRLDFWDDFSDDGELEQGEYEEELPLASLAVPVELPPNASETVTFLVTWHFPNRRTWTPTGSGIWGGDEDVEEGAAVADPDRIGNYYTQQYVDAWDVAEKAGARLGLLEEATVEFARTFYASDLPDVVKEAALFNASTLRSETCFRTPDGRFYGFEGCGNKMGCCVGSCTHVWNYEQATAFLYGDLSMSMREVSFGQATNEQGMMSFRVHLPIERAQNFGKAAADGQMGSIMRMYRDWQLSGDDEMLESLWPHVKRAMEFCWIEGGWDADKDGVMEGVQHNTMDVEYFGPNPQMGVWYLGALRASEEMARHLGDDEFADTCRGLFEQGSKWVDANLFNGEYYEHEIRPPESAADVAASLRVGMGAEDVSKPDFQLGPGCLVDQLVGQFQAHVCGLGYLVKSENVRRTLQSIMRYNLREGMHDHFNNMRSFIMGDESGLLMASYPKGRPNRPFPYFSEVMTGFEYAAAVGMLYEGLTEDGLRCITNIRDRYDGLKRSPFDEAECGHHYARAMASWGAVLALTGFQYSGVEKSMTFANRDGTFFWSNGYAWGTCTVKTGATAGNTQVELSVLGGELTLANFNLRDFGQLQFKEPLQINAKQKATFEVVGQVQPSVSAF